ncbi:hypothetical protein AB0D34_26395 [Streptomyces sp. NPDC048420]|uniref:hypothetical protein n=1 Tax=Streptomyces sp. NPDC048420 TaxID=3155755 RepID=UPI00342A44E9
MARSHRIDPRAFDEEFHASDPPVRHSWSWGMIGLVVLAALIILMGIALFP